MVLFLYDSSVRAWPLCPRCSVRNNATARTLLSRVRFIIEPRGWRFLKINEPIVMLSASRAAALTKEPAALDPLIISSAIVSAQFFFRRSDTSKDTSFNSRIIYKTMTDVPVNKGLLLNINSQQITIATRQ